MKIIITIPIFFLFTLIVTAQTIEGMVKINAGDFTPQYGSDKKEIHITDFYIDKYPVTIGEYLKFTGANSDYKKTKIKPLYAEENYLSNWKNDTVPGISLKLPVTFVSWFAAKKYCECQGKVLPTIDQWEYVGRANEIKPDGSDDTMFIKSILAWYEKPNGSLLTNTNKNYWGVYNMHTSIWEWTLDFNSVIMSGEGRNKEGDKNLFCGGGSYSAADLSNYAAFMRYSLRSSLKANYTLNTLGFRCAKTIK